MARLLFIMIRRKMTNEVTMVAASANGLCEALNQQISQGQELWNQVLTWLTEKGLSFAVNVAAAAVILLVGWLVIKLIRVLVAKMVLRGKAKETLLSAFVVSVVSKSCWAVLIVMVLGRLGVNVGPLIAGLGVTGFILGFAFQESLGNLASGLMIAINQPFKVGDYVIVAGLEGTIMKVDMMATELATADNKKVVIPNKSAWGAPITNFSALGKRRVDLKVGVAYESDMAKAIKVALETISNVPGVLKDPAPSVSIATLEDSEVTLNVRPWSTCADYWSVYSAGYQAVLEAFDKQGLDIPYPQVVMHSDK